MTTTMTTIERGLRIGELYQAWKDADSREVNKWVEMGLMTPAEFEAYEAFEGVEELAENARRKAENAVSRLPNSCSPKYRAALDRLDALRKVDRQRGDVLNGFRRCRLGGYYSSKKFAAHFQDLRENIEALIQQLPPEDTAALTSARRSVDAFERTQGKARAAAWDAHQEAQDKAGQQAYRQVIAAHSTERDAAQAATAAMQRRIAERRAPIIAEIRSLLEGEVRA